jgi:hypothetical protein
MTTHVVDGHLGAAEAAAVKGIQFNEPDAILGQGLRAAIDAHLRDVLPPGKQLAVVALANQDKGNAAIVWKPDGVWEVKGWIGKEWRGSSAIEYGVAVSASWP